MSAQGGPSAEYYCDHCKQHRRFIFNDDRHQALVAQSKNGLVNYSDIHYCVDNLLEVNNLSIDSSYNIRSYEKVELPQIRYYQEGVPTPKSRQSRDRTFIHLTQLPHNMELHMVLKDAVINTDIMIGRFQFQDLIPITTLQSDQGLIQLDIYPTSIAYSLELEQWLQEFIIIIELLPPTGLGLIIETLRYIIDNSQRIPSSYDIKFMKTILASHEVFFILEDADRVENLWEKYSNAFGKEQLAHIDRFIRILSENELTPIQKFTSNPRVDMDLISLIYLFHILEDEGVITIEIPGILEG